MFPSLPHIVNSSLLSGSYHDQENLTSQGMRCFLHPSLWSVFNFSVSSSPNSPNNAKHVKTLPTILRWETRYPCSIEVQMIILYWGVVDKTEPPTVWVICLPLYDETICIDEVGACMKFEIRYCVSYTFLLLCVVLYFKYLMVWNVIVEIYTILFVFLSFFSVWFVQSVEWCCTVIYYESCSRASCSQSFLSYYILFWIEMNGVMYVD